MVNPIYADSGILFRFHPYGNRSSILGASIAVAETTTVGAVDKVHASVEARQAGRTRALAVNSDVYFRDRCHSGEGARLQATLKDGTQLTLGENSTLVVDEFIYDPSRSRGELSLRVVKGAFLYVGGLIEGEAGAKVRIHTPVGRTRHHSLGRPNRQRLRSHRFDWRSHRHRAKGNCRPETRPGNNDLRQRQTSAGGRLAGGPDEARRRLSHLRKSAGSTVEDQPRVSAHERPRGIPQTGGEVGQRFEQSRMRPVTIAAVTPACDERWSSPKARRPLKRRWLPLRPRCRRQLRSIRPCRQAVDE
jgi:FecR protein